MAVDMTKATTLEQFGMLANDAADYTDQEIIEAKQEIRQEIQQELNYTHNQSVASAVWSVTHDLGRYPSVTVVDSSGAEVKGDVQYTSANTLEIRFSAPFAGKAYCN